MAKLTSEELLLNKLRAGLKKRYKQDTEKDDRFGRVDEIAMLLGVGQPASQVTDVCPSGIDVLDRWLLGGGGMPYGRVMEMSGGEGGGKSSLLARFLAGCQRDGGLACLAEPEQKLDLDWTKLHGVDPGRLILLQPDHLEHWFELVENLILSKPAGRPTLLGLDSVAALKCRAAVLEGLTGDAQVAEEARIWSRCLPLLVKMLGPHKVGLILVNQIRMKIGVMYGNPETTPGGNAIKFYSAVRLSVNYGKHVKDGAATSGRLVNLYCAKNQMSPPFRKAVVKLLFATGWDDRWSTLEHAKEMGCVTNKCRKWSEAMEALNWEASEERRKNVIDVEETVGEQMAQAEQDPVLLAAQEEG